MKLPIPMSSRLNTDKRGSHRSVVKTYNRYNNQKHHRLTPGESASCRERFNDCGHPMPTNNGGWSVSRSVDDRPGGKNTHTYIHNQPTNQPTNPSNPIHPIHLSIYPSIHSERVGERARKGQADTYIHTYIHTSQNSRSKQASKQASKQQSSKPATYIHAYIHVRQSSTYGTVVPPGYDQPLYAKIVCPSSACTWKLP